MDLDDKHTTDPGADEPDRKPLTWSDAPPSGNADPILWEHEVLPPPPPRAASDRGKIVAALVATGVFLALGFSISAPIYALSRWWESTPIATMTTEAMTPVVAQEESAPPARPQPASAPAAPPIAPEQEALILAPPIESAAAIELTPEEPPVSPPPSTLASEPVVPGPLRSEIPAAPAPSVDSSSLYSPTIDGVTTDPVPIAGVTIDPVTVERVSIDPVTVERVTIDPVTIDPVVIDAVEIDHVTIDPVLINRPESGPVEAPR